MNHNSGKQELCAMLAQLTTPEQVELVLADLCTIQEIDAIAQRLMVAGMLSEGKNYQQISGDTGVSTATISRVSRCLNYGPGGYEIALAILRGESNDNK